MLGQIVPPRAEVGDVARQQGVLQLALDRGELGPRRAQALVRARQLAVLTRQRPLGRGELDPEPPERGLAVGQLGLEAGQPVAGALGLDGQPLQRALAVDQPPLGLALLPETMVEPCGGGREQRLLVGDPRLGRRQRHAGVDEIAVALAEDGHAPIEPRHGQVDLALDRCQSVREPGEVGAPRREVPLAQAQHRHALVQAGLGAVDARLDRGELGLQPGKPGLGLGDLALALAERRHAGAELGVGVVDPAQHAREVAGRRAFLLESALELGDARLQLLAALAQPGHLLLQLAALLRPELGGVVVRRGRVDQDAPAQQRRQQRADGELGGTRQRHQARHGQASADARLGSRPRQL